MHITNRLLIRILLSALIATTLSACRSSKSGGHVQETLLTEQQLFPSSWQSNQCRELFTGEPDVQTYSIRLIYFNTKGVFYLGRTLYNDAQCSQPSQIHEPIDPDIKSLTEQTRPVLSDGSSFRSLEMELQGVVQMDNGTLASQIVYKDTEEYPLGILASINGNTICLPDTIWESYPSGFDVSFTYFVTPPFSSEGDAYSFTDIPLKDCYYRTSTW